MMVKRVYDTYTHFTIINKDFTIISFKYTIIRLFDHHWEAAPTGLVIWKYDPDFPGRVLDTPQTICFCWT